MPYLRRSDSEYSDSCTDSCVFTSAHLGTLVHQDGHHDGEKAQANEDVLGELHHRWQHHQAGVEGLQDGPVDVPTLWILKKDIKKK